MFSCNNFKFGGYTAYNGSMHDHNIHKINLVEKPKQLDQLTMDIKRFRRFEVDRTNRMLTILKNKEVVGKLIFLPDNEFFPSLWIGSMIQKIIIQNRVRYNKIYSVDTQNKGKKKITHTYISFI